ncbi:MAG: glycosyltransferase [Pseudomonadota bacterium]
MRRLIIAVAIATRGRADTLAELIPHLAAQTRPADMLVFSAERPSDLGDLTMGERIFGSPGVSAQRNRALKAVAKRADIIVFFDDDFVPVPSALEEIEALFSVRDDVVAATGRVIADGIGGEPISDAAARAMINADRTGLDDEVPVVGLYGCNMAIRVNAARDTWFDEALPLYGWQEDLDFGARLRSRGAVIRTSRFGGVHRGVRSARLPQRGFGYAQVANPVHLMAAPCAPRWYLAKLMLRNIGANLFGALGARLGREDPWTDRTGRLAGNVMALTDLMRGRLSPARAVEL